jgi:hypothetical protein
MLRHGHAGVSIGPGIPGPTSMEHASAIHDSTPPVSGQGMPDLRRTVCARGNPGRALATSVSRESSLTPISRPCQEKFSGKTAANTRYIAYLVPSKLLLNISICYDMLVEARLVPSQKNDYILSIIWR